jgi:hypothetical protein
MTSMMICEPAIRHTPLARPSKPVTTDPGRAAVEGARATGKVSISFWPPQTRTLVIALLPSDSSDAGHNGFLSSPSEVSVIVSPLSWLRMPSVLAVAGASAAGSGLLVLCCAMRLSALSWSRCSRASMMATCRA